MRQGIGDSLIDMLEGIFPILATVGIPGVAIVLVYKGCTIGAIKSRYKLYSKHPEYFEMPYGKEMYITNIDKVCAALKETKAPATATDATRVAEDVAKAETTNEPAETQATEDNND